MPDPPGAGAGAGPGAGPDARHPQSLGNSPATLLSASWKDRPPPGLFQSIRYSARSPHGLHPSQVPCGAWQAMFRAHPPTHPQEW